MDRRPIQARIQASEEPAEHTGPGAAPDEFKEAMAHWASGVTVIAIRDDGRVSATTVAAFASISAEPPLVLVSLGAGAQVLPFLGEGERFGISLLSAGQRRLATIFADSLPVGAPDFTDGDAPLLDGALAGLVCTVDTRIEAGDHHLVLARVDRIERGGNDAALVYFRRNYHALDG